MNCIRKGDAIVFSRPPSLPAFAAVAGKREGEGPLGSCFDEVLHDNALGQKCWEKAESLLQQRAASLALKKAGLDQTELDAVLCGDLQNQCTASGYALRELDMPSIGLYGACSTMVQALALAGCLVAGGAARRALAVTSSHFCAAERQFRTPLDYGGKRAPTAQWTVTGAGAVVVQPDGPGPLLRAAADGRVRDAGVQDLANMGAAMAPAAAETLLRFFADTGAAPDDFDGIYTGDLGLVGSRLLHTLLGQSQRFLFPGIRSSGIQRRGLDRKIKITGDFFQGNRLRRIHTNGDEAVIFLCKNHSALPGFQQ